MAVSILWRRLDRPGQDCCTLTHRGDVWHLDGMVVWRAEDGAARLAYHIQADARWQVRAARLRGRVGQQDLDILIARRPDGIWGMNGRPLPEAGRLTDLYLGFTLASHSLPLRRLIRDDQDQAEIGALWLDESDWQVKPLRQTYQRQAEGRWLYGVSGTTTEAQLSVDRCGFVTDYPGLWTQED